MCVCVSVFLCVHIRFPPITEDVLLQAFEVKPADAIFICQKLATAQYLLEEVISKQYFFVVVVFLGVG